MVNNSRSPASRLPAWPDRIRWLRRAALIIAVLAVSADLMVLIGQRGPVGAYVALAVTLAGVLLAWRLPWLGLALTVVGCAAAVAAGWDPTVFWTVVVYTLFSCVLAGVPAVVGGAVAAVLYALVAFWAEAGLSDPAAVVAAVAAVAAAGVGAALRAQWRYWTVLEQRAADAVAARQHEVEREVVEERLRIARDLHDLVGHEIAVLNMQIGVAEVSLPPDADRSRTALQQARGAVQSVLQETQQVLAVLRRGPSGEIGGQPMPGWPQVPELVDSFRGIGLRVEARIDSAGLPQPPNPAVGLAAYRIIQEALTNAHRYGDGRARLTVTAAEGGVLITVDNRRGEVPNLAAGEGSGHGLIGMTERAESLGGRIDVTSDDRGFGIRAWLPMRPEARR